MKKKLDLSKHNIAYGGKEYELDLYGREDYKKENGLWALSEACAEFVFKDLDGQMFFTTDEQVEQVRAAVQGAVYSLIKFRLLRPLNQQLDNNQLTKKQNKTEFEM